MKNLWIQLFAASLIFIGLTISCVRYCQAEELANLKPLAKPHYWRPIIQTNQAYTDEWKERIRQLARITGTVNVSLPWQDRDTTMWLRNVAEEQNAKIAFFCNFWHSRTGRQNPDWEPWDEAEKKKETDFYAQRIQNMQDWLGTAVIHACHVDCEKWYYRPWDSAENRRWNRAISENYATANRMLSEGFGEQMKLVWYQYGAYQKASTQSGWATAKYLSVQRDHSDMFSCTLYHGPEIRHQRDIFTRTSLRGARYGKDTMPYLWLGGGKQMEFDRRVNVRQWDYERVYSWQLGREINHPWFGQEIRQRRYAPWRYATEVYLWNSPHLFADEVGTRHFVAYVLGAAGDKRVE